MEGTFNPKPRITTIHEEPQRLRKFIPQRDPLGLMTGQFPIEYMERVTQLIREDDHPNQNVKEENPLAQKPKTKLRYILHPILQNLEELHKEPTMSCGKISHRRSSEEQQGEKTPKVAKTNEPSGKSTQNKTPSLTTPPSFSSSKAFKKRSPLQLRQQK